MHTEHLISKPLMKVKHKNIIIKEINKWIKYNKSKNNI